MSADRPLVFGTVEVAIARINANARVLQLHIRDGTLNSDELGMLIKFLQAKQDELGTL
ncbi:MAG: hypothetical protein ABI537_11090 [Casimicrobiaceae bacterium]